MLRKNKATTKQAEKAWKQYRKKTKGMEQMHKSHFMETNYPGTKFKLENATQKKIYNLRKSGVSWKKIYRMAK